MSTNVTNRIRLARALAKATGVGYQTALTTVIAAAENGELPWRLDADGRQQALAFLIARQHSGPDPDFALTLQLRYYRLREILAESHIDVSPAVQSVVSNIHASAVTSARLRGEPIDPGELVRTAPARAASTGRGWRQRVLKAGVRPSFCMPSHLRGHRYLPLDHALDERSLTGDVDLYESRLRAIVAEDPGDVDVWAHLGNLALASASGGDDMWTYTEPLTDREAALFVQEALVCYQTGVAVAELSLPDPFTGTLRWDELDNRPFHRALHGLALALWRLGEFRAAELTVLDLLWLDPFDDSDVHPLLPLLHARCPWAPDH